LAQALLALTLIALGLYMLWLAARRRSPAEAWVGLFFVATGLGAECFLLALASGTERARAVQLAFVGFPVLFVATLSGYAFTYTVFRRGEPWALAVVALGVLLALWGSFVQLGGFSLEPDISGPRLEFLLGRIACFAWGTFEGFRAYRMARRRLALGLADRVVVNRFLLFGSWFGLMGLMPITFALSRRYAGARGLETALALPPLVVGALMIIALVLTFFPPRRYLEWVKRPSKGEAP
jgi:hypothetical protein